MMSDDDRLPNPDDLDGQAAEIERQRRELEAAQQRLEQERRQHELDRQQQELERQRQELEAQRAHLAGPQATQPQSPYQAPAGPPPTQPIPQIAYTPTPAPAPAPRRRTGVIALVGIVALAAGAAAGWFGYDVVNDDTGGDGGQEVTTETTDAGADTATEESGADTEGEAAAEAEPTAEPTTAEPTATPVPIEVTTWKSGDGDLQASFPADYSVAWETVEGENGISEVRLLAARDFPGSRADDYNTYEGGNLAAISYSRAGLTPEILLGDVLESDPNCTGEDPPETVEIDGQSGLRVRSTDCGDIGGERVRIALQAAPDVVTYVSARSATPGATTADIIAASITIAPAADTSVAAPYGCAVVGPSTNPEFPFAVAIVNMTDETIRWYDVNPDTGQAYPGATNLDLESNFFNSNTYRQGTTLRVERTAGNLEYTVTDTPVQCILVTDEGLLAG